MPLFDINNLLKGGLSQTGGFIPMPASFGHDPNTFLPSASQAQASFSSIKPKFTMQNFLGDPNYANDRAKTANLLRMGLQSLAAQNKEIPVANIGGVMVTRRPGLGETVSGAANDFFVKYNNLLQQERTFNAFKPYFQQNMPGLNVDALNPMYGGVGFGDMSPVKLIELQNEAALRERQNKYYDVLLQNAIDRGETPKETKPISLKNRTIPYSQALRRTLQVRPDFANQYNKIITDKYYDPNMEVPFGYESTLLKNLPALPKPVQTRINISERRGGFKNTNNTSPKPGKKESKPIDKDPLGLFK